MSAVCYNCFQTKPSGGVCPFCGHDPAKEKSYPLALAQGSILNGRYIVGRVIGQGGFGITYIAQDYQTKERVAIKEYLPSEFAGRSGNNSIQAFSGDQEENFEYGKQQFLSEAKTLAAFNGDRHIVRIFSYFEENNTAYFVMEFVDGPALDSYMAQKGGRLSVEEANRLLLPLMGSLGSVHAKGIIHRDIAPDNILITKDGTAKLIDFGAARYSTGEKSKSLDVILKHGFAPTEQYMRRGRQGPFTDVYAMAATYYYAITGKIPPDAVERMQEDTILLPRSLGVRISAEGEDVLLKAMEVNAHDRYRNMAEFHDAMKAATNAKQTERPRATVDTVPDTGLSAREEAALLEKRLQELRAEAERQEREEKERLAREEAARREQERKEREAREEAARLERERKEREAREAEERRKKELAEQKAREEAERQEKLRLERERREEEKRLAAEKKKQEAAEKERLRQEAIAKRKAEQEQQRLEAERQKKELVEKKAREETERQEKLRREREKREEEKRLVAEQKQQDTAARQAEKTKNASKKKPFVAIIAAVLVSAVAIGYFVTFGAKKPPTMVPTAQQNEQPAPSSEQPAPVEQPAPAEPAAPKEQTTPEEQIATEEQTAPVEQVVPDEQRVPAEQVEQAEQVPIEEQEPAEPIKTAADYYAEALDFQAAGDWDAAIASFTEAGDYEDASEHIQEIQKELQYQEASELLNEGQYREALSAFEELKESDFKDSDVQAEKIRHLAAYRAQVWADPQIGDILTYGHYEQDNDLENGKEEIEWTVLDREDNRILVISRYGLDCQPYDTSRQNITWESCSIRAWLNSLWGNGFKTTAFNSEEQARIPTVTLSADQNPKYDTSSGNDTTDNIFLLSIPEADKYFSNDTARMCEPTAYAVAQGCMKNGNGWWWLRSPGRDSYYSAYVDHGGSVQTGGVYTSSSKIAVRPAMWIEFSGLSEKYEFEAKLQSVGNTVSFGHYEQDNDLTNGKEPIEWIVLDVEDGKSLLISKFALENIPYNTYTQSVAWETCSLRGWLNNSFLNGAFNPEEQLRIPALTVIAEKNPTYDTPAGNDTSDKVFLLSISEAENYFSSKEERKCKPTYYFIKSRAYYTSLETRWWWLRSPGDDPSHAANVSIYGTVISHGAVVSTYGAVRPAIWVNWE